MGQSAEETRDRRRSVRLDLQLPLVVRSVGKDGTVQEAEAVTLVVNGHGCLLRLKAAMIEGMNLDIVNSSSEEVRRGRVVWCGEVSPEGEHRVAIELEDRDPRFWGPKYAEAVALKTLSDTWSR